ncbi:MAG: DNA repair protein RadA [Bacteroidales bacterium]|nr:DNA repair protein RadA [Bacteroidales bacterium]
MAKSRITYICSNCEYQTPKWVGKCPSCGMWNSLEEKMTATKTTSKTENRISSGSLPVKLSEVEYSNETRIISGIGELDRVLGGGILPGSLVLVGGEPGIGKSTLMLHLALETKSKKIIYISGEESTGQISQRAQRIGVENENCYLLAETNLENILSVISSQNPGIVIIDSIQTVFSEKIDSYPGTVTQIRECAAALLSVSKKLSIPIFLIGHINKDGNIAGPKILEHIVDTVLQFEGDKNHMYRVLRSIKNRFGSTSEIGIFEMMSHGLREVTNPSELLFSQKRDDYSGIAISATVEGIRPFLIEVQALVSSAVYGTPQRSATGFDIRRLNMLLAVLEKRAGFKLSQKDVFLNIAGGIKVVDPGIDLAVICSILSSDVDISIHKQTAFAGEVGLSGEIRPVSRIEQRISEAEKLGFTRIFVSEANKNGISGKYKKIQIEFVAKIEDVFRKIFAD